MESISFNRVLHLKIGSFRARAAGWLLAAVFPACLPAQDNVVLTRVSATGPDVLFQVDQQWVSGSGVFAWPSGSKHTLRIDPLVYSPLMSTTRYLFSGWTSSAGPLSNGSGEATITADRHITWYNADLQMQYALTLSYYPCPDLPCMSPGTVWVNGASYRGDATVWVGAGSSVSLEAVPNSGYIFAGWSQGIDTLAPLYSFVLNAPTIVYPHFTTARQIQLLTSPSGLQLLADRTPVFTPILLEWGWNTTHALGVVSPQRDQHGVLWVYHSWSDGGTRDHAYQVGAMMTPDTIEARFVPEVQTLLGTEPSGLTLTVDGTSLPTPKVFDWGAGETHTVAAPLHAMDAAGGPWAFRAWSNGGASTQTILLTADQAEGGMRLTAQYDPLSRIRVESIPNGLALTVDGAVCQTPCEIECNVGSTVRLAAPASLAGGDGVRYDLESWDGAAGGSLVTSAGFRKITARYGTWYRLTLASLPAAGGSWQIAPASSDGFYKGGTPVVLGFTPADGMRFQGWELDLEGSANPATVVMNGPHTVRAVAQALPPAPPPLRVTNAAAETAAVAPGSIASLFGADLSSTTASSTADILPQSLGGITLRCAGRLLPLLYVSPEQVNFQLAGDLDPGIYRLELHREGGIPRQVDFTVAHNAPGLFAALHGSGSPITADAPARPGERVVLYGTGFGPYLVMPPDGFRVPVTPPDPLADSLEVHAAGRILAPEFAGAAPGLIGIASVEVVLPVDLEPGTTFSLGVSVGGIESNALQVPLR